MAYSNKLDWMAVATQIIFFCLHSDVVLVLDPWICQSVCLQSYDSLVKPSFNVSNVSHSSCTLPWLQKYLHRISMFAFTNFFLRLT